MIGYHAIPVIVDAYFKGQRDFDVQKAYKAMLRSATYDTTGIIAHNERILEKLMAKGKMYNEQLGYIPANKDIEAVAKALEYAYNDWCIAQMAKDLGYNEDYGKFTERSKRYAKYFDKSTGFMRGVMSDGTWRTPFDPRSSEHRKDDYCEGNAWQWTWFVPHDIDGLTSLFGSKENTIVKLDSLFSIDSEITGSKKSNDISGLIGQYARGNEPGHHIIHMYNYLGQPWKAQALVDSVLQTLYFNDPNGLAGNEDCGQMSAWYILNAMGFYPVRPGAPEYTLGRPIFDQISLNLENGKTLVINTTNNTKENKYIQSASLNGEPLTGPLLKHDDLMNGGKLLIVMGNQPNYEFGTKGI
jgi:predicted alpha-1,2-mannosidase